MLTMAMLLLEQDRKLERERAIADAGPALRSRFGLPADVVRDLRLMARIARQDEQKLGKAA